VVQKIPLENMIIQYGKILRIWLIIVHFSVNVFSQSFSFKQDVPIATIVANGKTLTWAGGLNAVQVSTFDLHNGDTISDLVVFDRYNQKISVFVGKLDETGKKTFTFDSRYEALFPTDISNWMLLVDYDNDQEADLFTFTPQGIRLFKNTYQETGLLGWRLIADPLYTIGFSGKVNLSVSASDIPAITDVDGDGDIDIVAFDYSGNFTELHKNFSMEETGIGNTLIFRRQGFCWGDFFKEHCKDVRFTIDCQTGQLLGGGSIATKPNARLEHTGNSLLLIDLTDDNKKDVLFGHVSCTNLAFMPNVGTAQKAKFNSVSYQFPTIKPIDFQIFPALFAGEFISKNNLVASPNLYQNSDNLIDFQHSIWLYEKTTTGHQQLTTSFLQEDMVDLGTDTSPIFVDIDGDGDMDLLVGNGGYRTETGYRSGVHYYQNIGTKQQAKFVLQTTDYLKLSEKLVTEQNLLLTNIVPFVADLNNDTVVDLGFLATTFKGTSIYYLPNKGTKKGAYLLSANDLTQLPTLKDLRLGDKPCFYDLDQDGDVDVLIGKTYGTIHYFQNTGTKQQLEYQLKNEDFGKVNMDYSHYSLSLAIADLNLDGTPDLLAGESNGKLRLYPSFLAKTDTLQEDKSFYWDTADGKAKGLKLGGNLTLALADLDDDGLPDLVAGTNTGGLRLLKNTSIAKGQKPNEPDELIVYPNPTNGVLYINAPTDALVNLYSIEGYLLVTQFIPKNIIETLNMTNLPTGMYLLKVINLNGNTLIKKVFKF
jgi:Secretion system C-terminal sorting domain/FG-GAP-like repeat/FG-GAP repeat